MLDNLSRWLLDPAGSTPHGFCLTWQPGMIRLHALSDMTIGLAYFTIPLALGYFISRRQDLVFRPLFLLFAAFIVLCGAGHWLDLLTLWVPAYGLAGLVKAATAAASVLTAIALWMIMPKALLLPSPRQLHEARAALAEREQQARELIRLNTDLEQFTTVASHDLKAPLHAIGQLAEWIAEDIRPFANPETLGNLNIMQQRTVRLQTLVASLLRYARTGHGKAMSEVIDLPELVGSIGASIAPPAGFIVRFQGEAQTIQAQRSPLEHVLRNLIANAIEHHDRDRGEVVVSMHQIDGVTVFRVADDGPGIEPRFHKRIFMIFQTLESRDEHDTCGIGLSIVQQTVERAGGTVWVESAPPERGTTFVFTWPQAVGA